ncbi:hypothetical protein [Sphingomonas sp. KC8]|uniref:hypothetical protein n=1 Tax=Sphingomonas sp. KC8 TaxID=1030157 RepID=UPI000312F8A5|nr:hypothetical protein [Sphingomonas sp. KC8]ARS29401.1 hypothetical protein KC8_19200 [Sphingomonas sp. KC8]
MRPSSTLCRAQEKLQLGGAAGTSLTNVRLIAEKAAASWRKEAFAADRREQRAERQALAATSSADDERRSDAQENRLFSENPDRDSGHA